MSRTDYLCDVCKADVFTEAVEKTLPDATVLTYCVCSTLCKTIAQTRLELDLPPPT